MEISGQTLISPVVYPEACPARRRPTTIAVAVFPDPWVGLTFADQFAREACP
jgi:hypothetical protein